MAALQFVDTPGYHAILFRKTFADLALPGALLSISKEWLMKYVNSGEVKYSDKEKKYTFPSGATLSFGYLENDNDCYRYQGSEFSYIGFDEVTHISPSNFTYLFSRLRKPKSIQVPLRIRATANPGGAHGEYYHERYFLEESDRIFIGAGLKDNPHLDEEEYKKSLEELDPVTREQLLNGNWDIKESGNMFKRLWFPEYLPQDVPIGTKWVRYWDLAGSDPKKNKRADSTVGMKLGYFQGRYFIDDVREIKATPGKVEKLVRTTAEEDGYAIPIRIEKDPGSAGVSIIDHYARNVLQGFDFAGVPISGSKTDRARPASAAAEKGLIAVNKHLQLKKRMFEQMELFPLGAHDDFVDGLSGSFNYFRGSLVIAHKAPKVMKTTSYWKKGGF